MKRFLPILNESLLYTAIILGIILMYVLAESNEVNFIYNQF
ncbi:MAG TPA: teichoic acid D-Ala incorporation-associated protein DltX [Desulfitobacterium dehalogenans]|uniref:Teichoic acid D-Ala incorporation-associated protein DltX n=1 Tax=Desulfitobacterium dehalogenans TaxID=36854 RepID=A0A7C7D5Y3_9FIRM|nr:teichoic acid D-Ala incorporation-associated protein DltX [Desulfitobacterium dehalogenans]